MRTPQRGVTLIEIAIVMTLVALLAGIATPAISSYIARARNGHAIGDIAGASIELYTWRTNHGAFPNTLAEADIDIGLDPWGNAYMYTNVEGGGKPTRKSAGRQLNSDFDLYSRGPDGSTAPDLAAAPSRDDIVRATDGSYVGPASEY